MHLRDGSGYGTEKIDINDWADSNALDLHAIANVHRPRFTCLLLKFLSPRKRKLGKSSDMQANLDQANKMPSSECFDILYLPGAFSGAHFDALAGTWLRTSTDINLWMIILESKLDMDCLARERLRYVPHGMERLIILNQDDVLLMPPGFTVVHAVHTMETSLMKGGMLRDHGNIIQTLQTAY
ncbi:hypothetical protein CERZMDRAFT_88080 [Cercospora zeae-maydis SCOH1-5]|uniref:JmjC domain-containing protein n=1 Tax=Cercospora zeae-maydis SCOH1-5 TaxID=717836 RepID=A0A6A6F3Y7_9PEZI|nr:hypothetical protein CERZMDRAFT_88080 [Cercospora zeae-maydis SCOH1-5]